MLSLCMVCLVYIGGCFFSLFMFCKMLITRLVWGVILDLFFLIYKYTISQIYCYLCRELTN